MGDSLFKLGRYKRVFLEIWAQIPIWAPMLKQWAVGSFFSRKYSRSEKNSRRAHRDPQKFFFFIKTSKWEKWWSWWLRPMLSYYVIYCEKFRKILHRSEKVALTVTSITHFHFDTTIWLCCTYSWNSKFSLSKLWCIF